jgi:4'-phosphopantetheinyl transferase
MPDRAGVDVWVVPLDAAAVWLPPTPGEAEHAARLVSAPLRQRYLRSHAALRAILRTYTAAALDFALAEHGKPYLPAVPELKFNLSHSHEMALVAVAWEIEVGVDVEWLRPLRECLAIAERFFPPAEAAALAEVPADAREGEFFRRWTRIEATLKARGIGLYGAGAELDGDWTVLPVDVGPAYTATVAASRSGTTVQARSWRSAPVSGRGSVRKLLTEPPSRDR